MLNNKKLNLFIGVLLFLVISMFLFLYLYLLPMAVSSKTVQGIIKDEFYKLMRTVVEEKISEIRKQGVRMYSQFPLLRGINDNSKVLIKLLIKMDELNIRPLSIFIPDPISYGAVNRLSASRIEKIMDEVNWNTPSWINSTRFVMDTTIGKVRRENIIKKDGKCITFARDGKTVDYYDLDDGIDVSSDIRILLWKD